MSSEPSRVIQIATIDGPAGEQWSIAKIFSTGTTEVANSARAIEPGDADAISYGKLCDAGSKSNYASDDLMTWNDRRSANRQFAFDDVQVGSADCARVNSHQDLIFAGGRNWYFSE